VSVGRAVTRNFSYKLKKLRVEKLKPSHSSTRPNRFTWHEGIQDKLHPDGRINHFQSRQGKLLETKRRGDFLWEVSSGESKDFAPRLW